jgi:hypothetical protein
MRRKKTRIAIVVFAICALAAGGAAFTAEVGGINSTDVAGFHQDRISGAVATGDTWAYSSDGQYVNSVTLTLEAQGTSNPLTGATVRAGFDQGTTSGGVLTPPSTGTPATDSATLISCPETPSNSGIYICDYTVGSTQLGVPIQLASIFNVQVIKAGTP